MTVASLWKALDRAGCGKRVGADELQDHLNRRASTNPWNIREMEKQYSSQENKPVLAVDLSIWICEALTSSAMQQNHVVDPSLQLVYSRTLKLLNLGIRLVVVIEGKRRIRTRNKSTTNANTSGDGHEVNGKAVGGEDKFRKRRSGARFWTACERCEELLKLLGVVVVRAKAEGEALCALLNQRGIVDGVISNDGDCLLYGAKVIYTKFSVENLDNSNVIRYDAINIRAIVDDDDAGKYDETGKQSKEGKDVVKLSRSDLIAFAILTGSDLAGDGLSKVGCRKAIRFIRKCQIDNPLKPQDGNSSPAMDLLLSWERAAISSSSNERREETSGPHCSCCGHRGTKKSHKKHGCDGCGTKPGELCFPLSPGGRFRKQLRAKALGMRTDFDPSTTVRTYHEPNENQIPLCLVGETARTVKMASPQLETFLESSLVVRGRSLQESREFVRKSLSAYLARRELFGQMVSESSPEGEKLSKLPTNTNRPVPTCINKRLVRAGRQSYEVKWVVKATTTDAEGNPLDRFEFSTIEDESAIDKCYPKLVELFHEQQKKLQQQGTAEQEKRRAFLLGMEEPKDQEGIGLPVDGKKNSQARRDCFHKFQCNENNIPNGEPKGFSDDVQSILIKLKKKKGKNVFGKEDEAEHKKSDVHIGRIIYVNRIKTYEEYHRKQPNPREYVSKSIDPKTIDDFNGHYEQQMNDESSTIKTDITECHADRNTTSFSKQSLNDYNCDALAPGHEHYLGVRFIPEFFSATDKDNHARIAVTRQHDEFIPDVSDEVDPKIKRPVLSKRARSGKHHAKPLLRNLSPTRFVEKSGHRSNSEFPTETYYDRMQIIQDWHEAKHPIAKEADTEILPTKEHQYCSTDKRHRRPSQSPLVKRHKDGLVDKINSRVVDTIDAGWNEGEDSESKLSLSHYMTITKNYRRAESDESIYYQAPTERHRPRHEEREGRSNHLAFSRHQRADNEKEDVSSRSETRFSLGFDVAEQRDRDCQQEKSNRVNRRAQHVRNDFDSDRITPGFCQQYRYECVYDSFQAKEESNGALYHNPVDEFKIHSLDQRKVENIDRLSTIRMLKRQIKFLEREQKELENGKYFRSSTSKLSFKMEKLFRDDNEDGCSIPVNYICGQTVLNKGNKQCVETRDVQDVGNNVQFAEHRDDICIFNPFDEWEDCTAKPFFAGMDDVSHQLTTKRIEIQETKNRGTGTYYRFDKDKRDGSPRGEEAHHMKSLHHDRDSSNMKGQEVEKRVAMKLESRNRRAQLGLLCSRYIEGEEFRNGSSSF